MAINASVPEEGALDHAEKPSEPAANAHTPNPHRKLAVFFDPASEHLGATRRNCLAKPVPHSPLISRLDFVRIRASVVQPVNVQIQDGKVNFRIYKIGLKMFRYYIDSPNRQLTQLA